MESSKLKKKFAVRGVIYLLTIISLIGVCIFLSDMKSSSERNRDRIKNETAALKRKIQNLSAKELKFSDAFIAWNNIEPQRKTMQGLRINQAKDLLDNLKNKYHLSGMNISFEKPEQVKNEKFTSEVIKVMGSKVSISFNALTDGYAYNFLDELLNQYPGYAWVSNFSISKLKEIDKETINKIANGEQPQIISVKLDLVWRDLTYTGPVIKRENNGNDS